MTEGYDWFEVLWRHIRPVRVWKNGKPTKESLWEEIQRWIREGPGDFEPDELVRDFLLNYVFDKAVGLTHAKKRKIVDDLEKKFGIRIGGENVWFT